MFRKMPVAWLCLGCTLWACAGGPVVEGGGPSVAAGVEEAGLPGAPSFSPELRARFKEALAARGGDYKARTHHLREDGSPVYTNRLILESSPYLIQHAHNPVNWYPWGDEAFETAKRLGRPVLLSIGYSTCHWCHVMERESFEDVEIARYMNENYVAIKVDREERPDVDAIYMSAVQTLTGRGGWPMTVWLTADRKPFYGGTYFPARDGDRGSRVGFLTLLRVIREQHAALPDRVVFLERERPDVTVEQLTQRIRRNMTPAAAASDSLPGRDVVATAVSQYRARFDPVWGGTKSAPKFPSNLPIRLLLRHHRRTGDPKHLEMASLTLEKMAAGGMHDQVGGGFHRYSTDGRWLVPHFEKMLYDNALLTVAYLEGYQATGREEFARVARRILRYVGREMTSPVGAFHSATDADSLTPGGHAEEGWFYTWTPDEMEKVLGEEWTPAVAAYYGVNPEGNFEGRSILHVSRPVDEVAREFNLTSDRLRKIISQADDRLYQARLERPAPLRDEKVLTSWNGLMISAFAVGGQVLGEESFLRRAEGAAEFVLSRMREKGRLFRSYMDGRARHNAYLDDYAFLTAGLLDLYEATSNPKWLDEALGLQKTLDTHYLDGTNGGYFMTSDDHEALLAREKPSYDGAEPSGNSVALMNLVRLHEFTTDDRFRAAADGMLRGFASRIRQAPTAMGEMLLALDFRHDTPKEIVIVTAGSRAQAEPFLSILHKTFLPNRILVVASQGKNLNAQAKRVPLLEGKIAMNGKATAYVCENRICKLPTTDPEVFTEQILAPPLPAPAGP